ncbi:hypothetical protein ANTPLA_LOCUS6259 [Anthophora plagiata]
MAESCESVVSSDVTSVVSHGQTKVPETPCQEDAETSGSPGAYLGYLWARLGLLSIPVCFVANMSPSIT